MENSRALLEPFRDLEAVLRFKARSTKSLSQTGFQIRLLCFEREQDVNKKPAPIWTCSKSIKSSRLLLRDVVLISLLMRTERSKNAVGWAERMWRNEDFILHSTSKDASSAIIKSYRFSSFGGRVFLKLKFNTIKIMRGYQPQEFVQVPGPPPKLYVFQALQILKV